MGEANGVRRVGDRSLGVGFTQSLPLVDRLITGVSVRWPLVVLGDSAFEMVGAGVPDVVLCTIGLG